MIRFILPTKFPDIAVAEAPKYDFPRVLEVGVRMLRRLVAKVREEDRKAECFIRSHDGRYRRPFDERSILLVREEICNVQSRFDISDDSWRLEAGRFVASLHPFGNVALVRTANIYRTTDGRAVGSLDPTPHLMVTRGLGDERVQIAFQPREQQLVHRAMQTFIDHDGVRLDGTPLMFTANCPHEAFGASTGAVRIKVVT